MKYLLPCPCGQTVEIETNQAGQTVLCGCGERLIVPSMLQIKTLPVAEPKPQISSQNGNPHRPFFSYCFFTAGFICLAFVIFAVLQNWLNVNIADRFLAFCAYTGLTYVLPILSILFFSLGCAAFLEEEAGILRKTFLILGIAFFIPALVFAVHLYKEAPKPQDVSLKQVFFSYGTNKRMLFQDSTPIADAEHQILWITGEDIDRMMPMDLYFYFQTLKEPTFSYNFIDNYTAVKDAHRIGITADIVLFVLALLSFAASFFMPRHNAVVQGWSGSEWQ